MRHVFLITARKGSKRCKHKNFKDFYGDRSLVDWAIDHAVELRPDDDHDPIIVSTDAHVDDVFPLKAPKMVEDNPNHWIVPNFNIHYLRRPDELCTDDATHDDVLKHFVEWFKDQGNEDDYTLTLMQPTSPFRSREDWEQCIKGTKEAPYRARTATNKHGVVYPTGEFYSFMVFNNRHNATRVSKHEGHWVNWLAHRANETLSAIDIDTEEDFLMAQCLAEHMPDSLRKAILPL